MSAFGKRPSASPDWSVVFDDPQAIRSIVDAAANVVQRVTFKIMPSTNDIDDEREYYLKVDTADVAYVSCISIKYKLGEVTVTNENIDIRFCIDCKHIAPCLANMRPDHVLRMEGHMTCNPKIVLQTCDPEHPSHETVTQLDTFVDSENVQLFPMDFDIMLEIDLVMLRSVLKQAQIHKSEHISISVYVTERAAKTLSVTLFSIKGELEHTQLFCHEVTKDEDGSMIVRAASDSTLSIFDVQDIKPSYEGTFMVDKIMGFVKPLQTRMILAKLKQDNPIMFQYNIGGGADDNTSYIRYLIAPVNTDSD